MPLLAAAQAVHVDRERLEGDGSRRPAQAGIMPPRPVLMLSMIACRLPP